jgi:flotillin
LSSSREPLAGGTALFDALYAGLRVPVLEQVAYLSLNIISIPLKIQRAYTKEGVPVTVEAVANVKIAGDDMSLR